MTLVEFAVRNQVVPRIIESSYQLVPAERISLFMVDEMVGSSSSINYLNSQATDAAEYYSPAPSSSSSPADVAFRRTLPGRSGSDADSGEPPSQLSQHAKKAESTDEDEDDDIGHALESPSIVDNNEALSITSEQLGSHSRSRRSMFESQDLHASIDTSSSQSVGGGSGGMNQRELVCVVSKDVSMQGLRIAWGAGLVGHVAMTGRSLNIRDAYAYVCDF